MLLVAVRFDVDPGRREEFEALAAEVSAATRAEDGCRCFEFWSDLDRSGRYLLAEGWESAGHLVAHRDTPHVARFKEALAGLGISSVATHRYVATETDV